MEVILAKTAGFCFGVKRAVDTVYKEAGKKNVYTYGPIIHNSEVVNDLKKKGVEVINSREELEALEEGTVIYPDARTSLRYDCSQCGTTNAHMACKDKNRI